MQLGIKGDLTHPIMCRWILQNTLAVIPQEFEIYVADKVVAVFKIPLVLSISPYNKNNNNNNNVINTDNVRDFMERSCTKNLSGFFFTLKTFLEATHQTHVTFRQNQTETK